MSQIQPDQVLRTEEFVVARKSDVYIVLPDTGFAWYFIRFHRPKERSSTENKLPKLPKFGAITPLALLCMTKSPGYLVKEIDDVRVSRMEEALKIPIAALQTGGNRYVVKWVEGAALLHPVGRYTRDSGFAANRLDVLERIDQNTILRIIDELSSESPATRPSRGEEPHSFEERIPSGTPSPICGVCKSVIDPSEEIIYCPHCGAKAHRLHMLEWIHVKGVCPACSEDVNEKELAYQLSKHQTRRRGGKGSAE